MHLELCMPKKKNLVELQTNWLKG